MSEEVSGGQVDETAPPQEPTLDETLAQFKAEIAKERQEELLAHRELLKRQFQSDKDRGLAEVRRSAEKRTEQLLEKMEKRLATIGSTEEAIALRRELELDLKEDRQAEDERLASMDVNARQRQEFIEAQCAKRGVNIQELGDITQFEGPEDVFDKITDILKVRDAANKGKATAAEAEIARLEKEIEERLRKEMGADRVSTAEGTVTPPAAGNKVAQESELLDKYNRREITWTDYLRQSKELEE